MRRSGISRLEILVRETVEGSFGRLFGGTLEPIDVATRLVQMMEDSATVGDVDYGYEVSLNPADHKALIDQNAEFAADLADSAWQMGRRYGLPMPVKPTIIITEDKQRRQHSFRISAIKTHGDQQSVDTTQVIGGRQAAGRALSNLQTLDAFLIINGKRHVPLDKPLITIGRRPDNDIVLDSATVSRNHAQIRWRYDRFVLYDVSNRGRTSANGETISEHVLNAGDVVAISDELLIYAEGASRGRPTGNAPADDGTHTLVFPPDRP